MVFGSCDYDCTPWPSSLSPIISFATLHKATSKWNFLKIFEMRTLKIFIDQVMGHLTLKFIKVQMRFNKPMCLFGIKTYCPFEVIFPKKIIKGNFQICFCNFLFIIFTIAPICEMFWVNRFWTNMKLYIYTICEAGPGNDCNRVRLIGLSGGHWFWRSMAMWTTMTSGQSSMPLDKNPGRCGYGYVAGKKTETEINLAASFHEWR